MDERVEAAVLTEDGYTFRDLNKNGRLDLYEDSRRTVEERVEDLLSQMTLEEKAGLMFHTMIGINPDGNLDSAPGPIPMPSAVEMVVGRKMTHFNLFAAPGPRQTAEWHNRLQKLAESTRLGIPVTLSSDPRHAFTNNPALGAMSGMFSQWPEPVGLAAIGDEVLVREFGDIARQEYCSVGIRVALHPMADLATEPRWARINGTFGEDAGLSARMTAAYIRGFQGETLGKDSVACMTKHFPGGGPQKDGEDAHFAYGKEQVYPGGNFNDHLIPFAAAFEAGTAQIMPYYGQPIGAPVEEVGFGFNKDVITGLLREKFGFEGIVCTDWGLLTDVEQNGQVIMAARAWGVEHLSREERARKALEAGVDQFGGEACPEVVTALVRDGRISEDRIDQSIRRILRDKFRLGLFDNPYLDIDAAERIAGSPAFRRAGEIAQRKSIVLLKNGQAGQKPVMPVRDRIKIYVEGIDPAAAGQYGAVVSSPEQADLAILRLNAPFEPRDGDFLERMFHAGDLDFKGEQKADILDLLVKVPTVVEITLDRPAVIPEINEKCAGLLVSFGANDAAVLDVIFGRFSPVGKLPFELPSSMEAVRKQKEDLPYDSENPLYPYGFGLTLD